MLETLYYNENIRVVQTDTHRELIFDSDDGDITQSSIELESIRSGLPYIDGFHIAARAVPVLRRVLFVGGGGCVGPTQFAHCYPDAVIDIVEVSPEIAKIADEYFWRDTRTNMFVEDARDFVARVADLHYDVVLMDAYRPDGRMVYGLDLERIGHVVMYNHLNPETVGTKGRVFRVPGRKQVLRMTGSESRRTANGPIISDVHPNLQAIWDGEYNA